MPGDRNTTHGRRRLWRAAAVLAALIAVALPVSGALAGGDGAGGGGSATDRPDAGGASIQTQERRQDDRRHDGDCPGKDRGQDEAAGGATDGSVQL
jgi:hypothetical protein